MDKNFTPSTSALLKKSTSSTAAWNNKNILMMFTDMMKKNYAFLLLVCLMFFISINSKAQTSLLAPTGSASISSFSSNVYESLNSFVGSAANAPNWDIAGSGSSMAFRGTAITTGSSGGWYGNGNMGMLGSSNASNGYATLRLQNTTGLTISSFRVIYTGQRFQTGANSKTITASWSTNSSSAIPAYANLANTINTFTDATSGIASGVVFGNTITGATIPNNNYVFIRFNHPGGSSSPCLGWDEIYFVPTPITQASAISFSNVLTTSMTVGWTNGNGRRRAVFMREASAGTITNPTDGTLYTASSNWSSKGSQLGSSGYYCIYDGTGTSVNLTNLLASTTYYIQVFEYNSDATPTAVTATYLTTAVTNNQITASANSITTSTITPTSYCAGATVSVPYTSIGSFTGTFTAQLSDASGSFSSPTAIGTGTSPISATIPTGTITGTGYRIRVVNNTPAINGTDNGANITINNSTTTVAPTATQNISVSTNGTTLSVTEGSTPSNRKWRWSTSSGSGYTDFSPAETGTAYVPNFASPGTYYVVCETTYPSPCGVVTTTSTEVRINVTANTITTSTITGSPFCSGASVSVPFNYTPAANFPNGTTTFTAQLSDASGSFTSATTIGTIGSDASGSQSISATIPGGTASGTAYRIRVISNTPAVNGANNGSDLTINTTITPSVTIASSPAAVAGVTTICAGTNVTFTPSPTNGGASPSYNWWKNGIGTGTNLGISATYSSSSLSNTDVIACVMTSNATCATPATVNSNSITMTVNALVTPSVTIASSPAAVAGVTTICSGTNVTFTPTPTNGGASPSYNWWKNGIGSGTNLGISATYSSTSLANGDAIACVMTSNATCPSPATANSNSISITNNTPGTPSFTANPSTAVLGQTGVVYTVTNVSGVTYNWSYSGTGATITGTGNSVTVDFSTTATSGTISVTASKSGCTSTAATVAVTVVPSALSDIIANATYLSSGYNSNIDYTLYQTAAPLSNTSQCIDLFKFDIRDGGGSTDADGLPTILNAITFNVTNTSMIRTAALFNGNALVSATPTINTGANTIAFSGLSSVGANVTAADGGSNSLTLRVTFLTTVTDNAQFQVTISNANVTAAGSNTSSLFTTFTSVVSSTTTDRNRIEVTATCQKFVQQPSNTTNAATMSPSVTVAAIDNNKNQDLDWAVASSVACSTPAALTGNPVGGTISSGLTTIGSLVHTVDGTYTLTASAAGLRDTASTSYVISSITYVDGDFMTNAGGDWNVNGTGTATWFKRVSGSWQTTSQIPNGTAGSYTVYITQDVTIPATGSSGSFATAKLYITNGATFTYSYTSSQFTFRNVIIDNGATLNMDGRFTILSTGEFEIMDGGTFKFSYTTSSGASTNLSSTLWNGTERFHPNSNFIVANHQTGSGNYFLPAAADLTANTYNGVTAYFGNLTLQSAGEVRLTTTNLSGTSTYLTHGDFTIIPSTSQALLFGSGTWVIGRDLKLSSPSSSNALTLTTGANTITLNVKRHLIKDGSNAFRLVNNASGSVTINVDSSVQVNSGTMDINFTSGGTGTVSLKGDLTVASSAILTATAASGQFNFNGTYNSSTPTTIQTIDNASAPSTSSDNQNARINFNVKQGAYAQLINQSFKLGNSSVLTVETGGIFDFNFDGTNGAGTNALNLTGNGITGTGFTSQSQAYLKISSPAGIVNAAGSTGNIQTNTAPVINTLETFHYIGKADQHTGIGIGTTSNGRALIVDLSDNNYTLTPDVAFGITSAANTYINSGNGGILDIRKGKFIETVGEYVTGSDGLLKMGNGTLYKIVKGYSAPLATGAEPATPNNFIPRLTGTYTLTGGTIELGGNSTGNYFQTLRGGKTYYSIKFSGSNTYIYPTNSTYNYKNLTSNVTINDSLYISETAVVDCIDRSGSAASFTGNGGLVMDGGRIRIKNSSSTQPELVGDNVAYNLTGGTVEFYGTSATQQQQMRGNYTSAGTKPKVNYYNVDINADASNYSTVAGAGNVDLNSSFTLSGIMNVNSPAVLRMDKEESIDGSGTFNINDGSGLLYGGSEGTSGSAVEGLQASGTGINDGNIRTTNRSFSQLASYGFISSGNMPTGDGLPSTVAGLYVYKTNAADVVTLNNAATTTVNGILSLQNGKILSSGSNKLILEIVGTSSIVSPANVGGLTNMGYDNSYVIGQMGYKSASTSEMIFPIGSAAKYGPIALTPQGTTAQTYTCDYTSSGYGTYTLDPSNSPQLDHVSLVEYWNVNSSITPSVNDDAKIKLFWRIHSKVGPSSSEWSQLRVAHFDGTDWNTEGTSSSAFHPSPSTSWGWVQSDNYAANFSPFTFGTLTSLNPLPVELTSFTGTCLEDGISRISWSTASEFNSKEFIVQRSEDGIHYTAVAVVPAAGFSNQPRNYSITDTSVYANSSYYRLIELDKDGKQSTYSFIQVKCNEVNGVHIYYTQPRVVVEVNSTKDKQVGFNVYEVSGKLLHQEDKQIVRGYNRFDLGIKNKLTDGIYIIQMIDGDHVNSTKVIVH